MSLNFTVSTPSVKLHATAKLPTAGKIYFCFQINGESYQAAKCVKYRIILKVVNSILSIDTF